MGARPAAAARGDDPFGGALPGRPLLLATARDAAARPATRAALALAAARGLAPHALRVHDVPALDPAALGLPGYPDDPFGTGSGTVLPDADADAEAERVRAELAGVSAPPGARWSVRVAVGAVAPCVVREARRLGAALVVVGLRRHGLAERALGDNAAVGVLRDAPCPVLAVTDAPAGARLAGLPRRVLVATDFGRTSVRAAHAALALVADGGTLVLAHVGGPGAGDPAPSEGDEGAALVHALGVDAAFERLETELAAATPAGRAVGLECLAVPPAAGESVARALLAAAARAGADLIAVATQRITRAQRLFLGSVTTELARDGGCSLLVVPPR